MQFPLDPDLPYHLAEADFVELGHQFDRKAGIDWGRLLLFAEERELHPGDRVIRQFECDSSVYVLTRGELEVRVAAVPGGVEQPLAGITPVAILGEQGFLDDGPRTASVIATRPATVYRLTRRAFDQLRAQEPDVGFAFLMDIARSLSLRSRSLLAKQLGL